MTADEHAVTLAALDVRVRGTEEDIARHERQLQRLDDAVVSLREIVATVARKSDVDALRKDVTDTFAQSARDAHNSIPQRAMAIFAGAMFLIALAGFVANLMIHHAP